MDPTDFNGKIIFFSPINPQNESIPNNNPTVSAVDAASRNIPSTAIVPAGTFTPVDTAVIQELGARVRTASPEQLIHFNPIPESEKTAQKPDGSHFLVQPIQIRDCGHDLSTLRFFRDYPEAVSLDLMAAFCLDLEKRAFSEKDRPNLRQIGDFFRVFMARSEEFREKMCTCKVLISDMNNPLAKGQEVLTNATTFLIDNQVLMTMAEVIGAENPAEMPLYLKEDPTYAIPAIRYLETGNETILANLDVYELAYLASKWGSSRLQTYCKKHFEEILKETDDQYLARLMHLCRLNDDTLNFIFQPMAAKAMTYFKTGEKWCSTWDKFKPVEQQRLIEAQLAHLRSLETDTRRKEHPDRVRYSLELLQYINARKAKMIPQNNFYVTARDVNEALRVLLHAALYMGESLSIDSVYDEVLQLKRNLSSAKELLGNNSDPEIEKTLKGWCAFLCNQLKPNLPDSLLRHPAWHGDALSYAVDDISSEKTEVITKCDDFVLTALKREIQKYPQRRVAWMIRPTTNFVSEGVVTACFYDAQTKKYERLRFKCEDGLCYRYNQVKTEDGKLKYQKIGEGYSEIGGIIVPWAQRKLSLSRYDNIWFVARPNNQEEREKIYDYIKH